MNAKFDEYFMRMALREAEKAAAEIKPEQETTAQAEVAEVAEPTNATV